MSLLRFTLLVTLAYLATVIWLWNKSGLENSEPAHSNSRSDTEHQNILVGLSKSQQEIQKGTISSSFDNETFHSNDLAQAISYIPNTDNTGTNNTGNYIWQDNEGNPFAYAALGIDRNHHFANSFLIGYEPYKTDQVWQPLVTIALKKTYQFDHDQHGPAWSDVWQNSRQAYLYSHGDCEDHAILLADWLISMGYDARVAIGNIPSGGHAWVILFHDDKEYLLEATSKRRPRSTSDFTQAKYAPEYQPKFMFNRTTFWVNTGSQLTTQYRNEYWKPTATFTPENLNTSN